MEQRSARALESLSWMCHLCGLFSIVVGFTLTFMNFLNRDYLQVQSSLYIFATGYALVKISTKITKIVNSERIS